MSKVYGVKDIAKDLAEERGISLKEATSTVNDLVEIIASKCVDGGVSFKDVFTIKPILRKGRTGKSNINGKEWKSEDKYVLKITTGKGMSAELNK